MINLKTFGVLGFFGFFSCSGSFFGVVCSAGFSSALATTCSCGTVAEGELVAEVELARVDGFASVGGVMPAVNKHGHN